MSSNSVFCQTSSISPHLCFPSCYATFAVFAVLRLSQRFEVTSPPVPETLAPSVPSPAAPDTVPPTSLGSETKKTGGLAVAKMIQRICKIWPFGRFRTIPQWSCMKLPRKSLPDFWWVEASGRWHKSQYFSESSIAHEGRQENEQMKRKQGNTKPATESQERLLPSLLLRNRRPIRSPKASESSRWKLSWSPNCPGDLADIQIDQHFWQTFVHSLRASLLLRKPTAWWNSVILNVILCDVGHETER